MHHHLPSDDPVVDAAFDVLYEGDETVPDFDLALMVAAELARTNCRVFR